MDRPTSAKASSSRSSMRRKQEEKQQGRKRRQKHILHRQCSSSPSCTSILPSSLLPFNLSALLATSLLATLLFLTLIQPTEAFAAWLAEDSKCYTDLQPGEIIMNAPVVPYSKSQYPDIGILVYDEDGRLVEPTVAVGGIGEEKGGGSTASTTVGGTVDGMKWSGHLNTKKGGQATTTIIEQSDPRSTYTLHLSIPSTYLPPLGNLGDVQYVMDLSLSSPAEFVGSNTGCDFRRAYGEASDKRNKRNKGGDGVKLKIDFDGEAADEVDAGEVVKVWAGWAAGHEAVTLTREVVFVRKKDGEGDEGGDEQKKRGEDMREDSGEADTKLDEAAIKKVEDAMDRADKAAAAAAAAHAAAAEKAADRAAATPSDKTPHTVETAQDRNRWAAADYEGGGASKSKLSEEEEKEKQKKEVARNKLKEMRRNVHHPDGGHDADAVVRDQIGVKNKKKNKNDGDTDDDEEGEYENKQRRRRRDFDLDRDQHDIESRKRREHRTKPDVTAAQTQKNKDRDESSSKKRQSFRQRYHHTDLGMQNFSMRGYFVGCGMMATIALGLARYSAIVGRRLHKGTRRL